MPVRADTFMNFSQHFCTHCRKTQTSRDSSSSITTLLHEEKAESGLAMVPWMCILFPDKQAPAEPRLA
jgi:hypothetical protein